MLFGNWLKYRPEQDHTEVEVTEFWFFLTTVSNLSHYVKFHKNPFNTAMVISKANFLHRYGWKITDVEREHHMRVPSLGCSCLIFYNDFQDEGGA